MTAAVRLEHVSIMFGDRPERALPLADQGLDRAEIQARSGQVLGVHDCTVEAEAGETLVLMGLSGSGKSTLLRAINGLNKVARGRVLVRDGDWTLDVVDARPGELRRLRRECVSMVFQQFGLLPWRNVLDNVAFGLELAGLPRRERERAARERLEMVGLAEWADRRVAELSGGMQQRVGLARAFAADAPILLMDEPFSALDPLIRTRLQDELIALQKRLRRTIVFVSHDLDEAFRLGDRIAIMEGGRIAQQGAPAEILRAPATPYVAAFVAGLNPLGVLRAEDMMRPGPIAADAPAVPHDAPAAAVAEAAAAADRPLAVTRDGVPVGVIRPRDVLAALAGAAGRPREAQAGADAALRPRS